MVPAERSLSGWAVAGLVAIYLVGLVVVWITFVTTGLGGMMSAGTCARPYEECERWVKLTVYALLPWAPLTAVVGGIVALRARSPRAKLAAVLSVPAGAGLLLLIGMAVIGAVLNRVSG